MGLDVYLCDGEETFGFLDLPSEKHPKHLWNKRYLRSAYNDFGFDAVADTLAGMTLWTVFAASGDEPEFRPDWAAARVQAEELLVRLRRAAETAPYMVMRLGHYHSGRASSRTEARDIFLKQLGTHPGGPTAYSCCDGDFWIGEPCPVVALIPGSENNTYLVYKAEPADLAWYIEAAEVLLEFIDYAQTLKDPVLHWSY